MDFGLFLYHILCSNVMNFCCKITSQVPKSPKISACGGPSLLLLAKVQGVLGKTPLFNLKPLEIGGGGYHRGGVYHVILLMNTTGILRGHPLCPTGRSKP